MELKPLEKSKIQIPDCLNNLNEKLQDQFKIHWRSFPQPVDWQKYKSFHTEDDGSVSRVYKTRELILDHVEKIENLKIGKPIETPNDLVNCEDMRLQLLFIQMVNYAFDHGEELKEGESEASE